MNYRLVPVINGEDNIIIKAFDAASLSKKEITKIVGALPEFKKFMQNAILDNKLALLDGGFRGKEEQIYIREETIRWLMDYLDELPKQIAEARRKQILKEAEKENQ